MKIFHILNSYLPQHIAGTEVYVSALVRELKKQNIHSKVIIPNYGKLVNESYFFEDVEVIKYAEPSVADRDIITGNKAPKGLYHFINLLNDEKPDIVHFHELAGSIGVGLFHVKATKANGFKIIMTFHLSKYTCKTGTLMYKNKIKCDGIIRELQCSNCWLNATAEKGLKALIIKGSYSFMYYLHLDTRFLKNNIGTAMAFSHIIADIRKNLFELRDMTDRFIILTEWYKNILINNGIHQSHIALIKQGLPNENGKKNFIKEKNKKLKLVFIGRISHFKGVDMLLNALKQIHQSKVELYIYGSALEPDYMNSCLKIASGMDNIFWKGSIAPLLVLNTIREYDILCVPSYVCEMSPLVIQEAFAAGIPVLASNVYGNTEQIEDGENGWLFNFKDITDLKNKIENLIINPTLINDAVLKIKAVKSFETIAEEHISLYEQILF